MGIVEQSCYFAKICDDELHLKDIGVKLFSWQLFLHEYMLRKMCENSTTFVSRCLGLLLEDFRSIGRSFDKSRKLMILKHHANITMYF